MKQSVYYLYEYQGNHQVRNVGFIKCQHKDNQAIFQIHGKGMTCSKGERYEMNLFCGESEMCYISRAGHVESEQGKINYIVTVDEVEETIFDNYDGLYIHVAGDKRYVAMWTPKKVAFHQMESFAKLQESSVEEIVEYDEHENREFETEVIEQYEEINCHEEIEAESLESHKRVSSDCDDVRYDECPIEAEECCYDAVRRRRDNEHRKEEHHKEERRQEATHKDECCKEEYHEEVVSRKETVQYHRETTITYEKIERQDIAKLPQREWRLANNSFLLHGYHNYHHILFIQEAGRSFVGVPGVYAQREADVAKSFGFPVFHRIEPGQIDWEEDECDLRADFGYWCKEVSYRASR